jgi:hypothetical protein
MERLVSAEEAGLPDDEDLTAIGRPDSTRKS